MPRVMLVWFTLSPLSGTQMVNCCLCDVEMVRGAISFLFLAVVLPSHLSSADLSIHCVCVCVCIVTVVNNSRTVGVCVFMV